MKPYPSVMKEKRRHILFKMVAESKLDASSVNEALWNSVKSLIGTSGAAEASFMIERFDEKNQTGLIRCTNEGLDRIRACLTLLHKVNNKKAYVHIIRITGTIKKADGIISSS